MSKLNEKEQKLRYQMMTNSELKMEFIKVKTDPAARTNVDLMVKASLLLGELDDRCIPTPKINQNRSVEESGKKFKNTTSGFAPNGKHHHKKSKTVNKIIYQYLIIGCLLYTSPSPRDS